MDVPAFPSPTGLYKVLGPNGAPCNGGSGLWRVGRKRSVRGTLIPCERGLHVCTLRRLLEWLGPAIHPVLEASEERIEQDDKIVLRSAVIGPAYTTWNEQTARLFACDVAERVLPIYERAYPGEQRPHQAIEVARRFARGQATKDELTAAREAAWGAAREAAWGAAREAAREAAWGAAWGAAREAAWEAAREAERAWQTERLSACLQGEVAL